MRVFGIICEYNPFHRGHKWQIDELRRLAGEEECAVVCAMSGDFVQRGDFAIERAHARAVECFEGAYLTCRHEAQQLVQVAPIAGDGVRRGVAFAGEAGQPGIDLAGRGHYRLRRHPASAPARR